MVGALLAFQWWETALIAVGALFGVTLLVFMSLIIYLIVKGKLFNKKNESCVESVNEVKPRAEDEKQEKEF